MLIRLGSGFSDRCPESTRNLFHIHCVSLSAKRIRLIFGTRKSEVERGAALRAVVADGFKEEVEQYFGLVGGRFLDDSPAPTAASAWTDMGPPRPPTEPGPPRSSDSERDEL